MCLVTLGCGFPSFHFCNLWVTQKPLPGGFPWKGLWQHLLRMGGLCDSLSQCLLCVTFCPQSQGPDSHCSFWPCTVSGLGFEKPHSLSAASTWGCLGPFLSYSDESMRSYFMQGPASFNSCTTRKGSPKWPFCGGFNSTGPLMTWVVGRLISFDLVHHIVSVLGTGRDWLSVADVNEDITPICVV